MRTILLLKGIIALHSSMNFKKFTSKKKDSNFTSLKNNKQHIFRYQYTVVEIERFH